MSRLQPRIIRRLRPLLLAWCVGLVVLPAAAEEAAARPTVEIDLEALLTDPRVTAATLDDPVWSVELDEGAVLFQVPVRVVPGTEVGTLDRPATGLVGARLLGWSVPAEEAPDNVAPRRGAGAGGPETRDPRLDAPRIAEELTVRPDGALSWEAQRFGRGFSASGSGTSLYAFLLDPDRLRELRPEAPERAARGTDRAEVRAAADAYRAERDAYAALSDAVNALPERIEGPADGLVWLVYERRRPDTQLVFEDRNQSVWTVDPGVFAAYRTLAASTTAAAADIGDAGLRPGRLVQPDEPLGAEAAALAAGRAIAAHGAAGAAGTGGAGGTGDAEETPFALALAEAVTADGTDRAVRRLVFELAKAVPPTPTTVRLIAAAAPRAGDFGQVASLRARLLGLVEPAGGGVDPETGRAVAALQALLEDPDGPAAGPLVDALADAAAERPAVASAAASTLRAERLPEARLGAFVEAVLRRADAEAEADAGAPAGRGTRAEPAAAGVLLDRTLLRSFDARVVRVTLDALEASAGGRSRLSPVFAALRSTLTSSPAADAAGANPPGTPGTPGIPDRPLTIAAGSLELTPADHGLLQQLRSGDAEVRAAAASALRLFRLPGGGGGGGGQPAAEADAVLTNLLAATGDAAPAGLVTLLSRSPDTPTVNAALLRLLGRAEGVAAMRLGLRLSGSGRDLGPPLAALEPAERVAVAAAALGGGAGDAPAAGLVLDPAGATFVGERLSEGRPVTAAALAAAVGDEAELLRLAAGADEALARGAMAGLAATAGADPAGQVGAVAAMTEGAATPADAWPAIRDRLRLAQLARAAGSYRLDRHHRP